MENSLKNQIVTLGNGNKYFVLEETKYDEKVYDFLLNIDDENKIEIAYQDVAGSMLILRPIKNESEKEIVTKLFNDLINKK